MPRGKKNSTKLSVNVQKKKSKQTKSKIVKEDPSTSSGKRTEEILVSYEKIEKEKKIIMWSGVSFFMILVAVFWIYNIKQVFEETKIQNQDNNIQLTDWKDATKEITDQLSEIKDAISNNDEVGEENKENAISTLPMNEVAEEVNKSASSTVMSSTSSVQIIEE